MEDVVKKGSSSSSELARSLIEIALEVGLNCAP
jgi:hypothetical protein